MSALSTAILKLRDFRLLLLTRMLGTMALQCQSVIVGWQVYSLSHDTFLLGLTGLTEAVPAIGCALVAGHIVDIGNPQKIYLGCMATLFANTLMLFLIAGGLLPAPGGSILPWLFVGVFFSGLARSFSMPAAFSLLPRVVPRADIASASAWLNSGFQVAAIGGPAIAGILFGAYGARVAWLLPMTLMALGFLTVSRLRIHHVPDGKEREPAIKSIRAGWAFMLGNRIILATMALDMFAVLFGGAVAMLPAYADQVLHVGAQGLGALRAAPALGAVLMAFYLALRPYKQVRTATMLCAVVGFGICMIGFGLSHVFWLSMVFLAFSGAFDCVSVVIRATVTQLLTPREMMGRVSSVKSMFVVSSNEIGSFESGTMATVMGLVPSVVFGGVATLFVAALTVFLAPEMRYTTVSSETVARLENKPDATLETIKKPAQ
jgi:MFS family permease